MLATTDMKGTAAFYINTLRFEIGNANENISWMHLHKGTINIMFRLPNEHEGFEKPTLTGSLYFYTDEVDELWEELKDTALIYYGIEDFDYGMREFAIKDNNGYVLQFGREITG
jgi:uncharacterized glyoxalase superfamily protein PhnB